MKVVADWQDTVTLTILKKDDLRHSDMCHGISLLDVVDKIINDNTNCPGEAVTDGWGRLATVSEWF